MNTSPPTPPSAPEVTDEVLVQQAKAGDFEAFDTLVRRHERRLYALAMTLLRNPPDAEEAVQTALLNALEHLDGFREEASFATWITRITTHTALKVIRKRKGLPTVSLDAATEPNSEGSIPHPEYIADWSQDPSELAQRSQVRTFLEQAAAELPESYRIIFLLRDVRELSVKETASILGITEGNVKVRLLRARLALREILTRRFGDPSTRLLPHKHDESDQHDGDGHEHQQTRSAGLQDPGNNDEV